MLCFVLALGIITPLKTEATVYSNGDVDGDGTTTSYDALLVGQYLKGYWYTSNSSQLDALDVNNDYIIDYVDVQCIMNIIVGVN